MGVIWCDGNADFHVVSRFSEREEMEEKLRQWLGRNLKSDQSKLSGLVGSIEFAKESVFSPSYYTTKVTFLLASTQIKTSDAWGAFKESCTGVSHVSV